MDKKGEGDIMDNKPIETWDGYYEDGTLAGMDLNIYTDIPKGIYRMICVCLVRHVDGDYLLMQRDPNKMFHPSWFEATAGGTAFKGESKYDCIKRELFEETGIRCDNFTEINRTVYDNRFVHSFICTTDCDKDSIVLQKGETVAYRWVSEDEFIRFINSDDMIPSQRERYRSWYEKMGYMRKQD